MSDRNPIVDAPNPPLAWGERAQLICGGPVFLVVDTDGLSDTSMITLAGPPECLVREFEVPRWAVRRVE